MVTVLCCIPGCRSRCELDDRDAPNAQAKIVCAQARGWVVAPNDSSKFLCLFHKNAVPPEPVEVDVGGE